LESLGALTTLQAGEVRSQFGGIQTAFALAGEELALLQVLLSLGSAIQCVGVAVVQGLTLLQVHHGTQSDSLEEKQI